MKKEPLKTADQINREAGVMPQKIVLKFFDDLEAAHVIKCKTYREACQSCKAEIRKGFIKEIEKLTSIVFERDTKGDFDYSKPIREMYIPNSKWQQFKGGIE